jgi:exopolysaccharide biosynthesis polyprenyl glycosylphosphotransferase
MSAPAPRDTSTTTLAGSAPATAAVGQPAVAEQPIERPTSDRYAPLRLAVRAGVGPFLLVVDLIALGASTAAIHINVLSAVVLTAALLSLNASAHLYQSRLTLSVLDDLPSLVGRGLAAAALTTAVGVLFDRDLASSHVIEVAALYLPLVVGLRGSAYMAARGARARGLINHHALVLGAGEIGGQVVQLMLDHPEYGLSPVGFLDPDPWLPPGRRSVPVIGTISDLARTIERYHVTQIIIAFGAVRESEMIDVLRTCDRLSCEIFFVPRLFEVSNVAHDMDQLWGMPLVRLRRAPFRSFSWHGKRLLDIVVSAVTLVMLSPLYAVIAVAVRLETHSGVLFRQQRVGLDGRPFEILKFCSMRPATEQESQTNWSIAVDDRVGPIGRLLRRSSLDELPQLWNVLRGDMSLVGPRPERPFFVTQFDRSFPRYMARHRVPAGMTGWSQVHGLRGDTSIEDRARFDNFYVENWSLWFDIKLIARTVSSLVRHSGQ